MRRSAFVSSCLALGVPAALGALLVSSTLLPPTSALLPEPTPVAATLSINRPMPSSRSERVIDPARGPAPPVGQLPAATNPFPPAGPLFPAGPLSAPNVGAVWPGEPATGGALLPIPLFPRASAAPGEDRPSDDRFARAEHQRQDGDLAGAVALLQTVRASADPATAARAQFLIGRADLLAGDVPAGSAAFQSYLRDFPTGADAAGARFALASELDSGGKVSDAVPLYRAYLAETTDHVLDGAAWLAIARDEEGRDATSALADYRRAVDAGLPLPDELDAAAKVANLLTRSGRGADAVSWYADLANHHDTDDPARGRYLLRAADAAARAGEPSQAARLLQQLGAGGAASGDVATELSTLRGLGVVVDDVALGDALLRDGSYLAAASAYGDYLDAHPDGTNAPTARLERGRALLSDHDSSEAVAQLQKFLDLHGSDPRAGDARALLAQAQTRLDNQNDGGATGAATVAAPRLAFSQGWTAYEALDFTGARQAWLQVRQSWPTDPGSPAALLWLAKLELRSGDNASALADLRRAWSANPGDFYAFRARELATSLDPTASAPAESPEVTADRPAFEAWLASWTHTPADAVQRPYLDAPIARGTTLPRIRALMGLGLGARVDREYQTAMDLYWSDGRSLYALADVLSQVGLDAESMKAAYRLLMLSPAPNAYQSPGYLQRLVYPYPYRDLVESAARASHVDPLLLVALIRQESSFDPKAGSSAGARGLTQFMPATAATLAPSIGLTDFSEADLNQPAVAIRLGAAYLGGLTRDFGGNPYLALAAYNAGAGNLRLWLGDNPRGDFDLLAEEVPYSETRDYVRNVYRFYQEYVAVYRGFPG